MKCFCTASGRCFYGGNDHVRHEQPVKKASAIGCFIWRVFDVVGCLLQSENQPLPKPFSHPRVVLILPACNHLPSARFFKQLSNSVFRAASFPNRLTFAFYTVKL
jgi:hypothetical protein